MEEHQPYHPCPAICVGILNFDQPTIVKCGLLEGHDGPHRCHIEWGEQDIETIARYFPDRPITLNAQEHAKYVADVLTQGGGFR